jgi:hypothetical protein
MTSVVVRLIIKMRFKGMIVMPSCNQTIKIHCEERSDVAIYGIHIYLYLLDCFVVSLLAMTQNMTFYEAVNTDGLVKSLINVSFRMNMRNLSCTIC